MTIITPLNTFNVRSFGAKGDGSHDDTAAFQAAINAAIDAGGTGGATVFIPPTSGGSNTYVITSTLLIQYASGFTLRGAGSLSVIEWRNTWAQGVAAIVVSGCHHPKLMDFKLEVGPGFGLDIGIQLKTPSSHTEINTQNVLSRLRVESTSGQIENCIDIGAPSGVDDANNDQHHIEHCQFLNYNNTGVRIWNTQSVLNNFLNCNLAAWGFNTITNAHTTSSSGSITSLPANTFIDVRDIGKTIEVTDAGQPHGILRTVITAVPSTTSITVSPTIITGSSTATITTSGQYGIRCIHGGFCTDKTGAGDNMLYDFSFDAPQMACRLLDANCEGSRAFLQFGINSQSIQNQSLTVINTRFAANGVQIWSPVAIKIWWPGTITFIGGTYGDPLTSPPLQVDWNPSFAAPTSSGTETSFFSCTFMGTTFSSSFAPNDAIGSFGTGLFAHAIPKLINCTYNTASNIATPLEGIALDLGAFNSSTNIVYWGSNGAAHCSINQNFTFTFSGLRLGKGGKMRLHVKYVGGNWTTTWPAIVNWGAVGPPSPGTAGKTDIFEFIYDGITVFATIIGNSFTDFFLPSQRSGLLLWLRADLGITLNSGNVSVWADQSGNGNNAVQATGGNQPLYVTSDSSMNFQPSVSFTGSTTKLDIASLVGNWTQPITYYIVGKSGAPSGGIARAAIDNPSGARYLIYGNTSTNVVQMFYDGTNVAVTGVQSEVKHAYCWLAEPASTSTLIYVDTYVNFTTSGSTSVNAAPTTMRIGNDATGTANNWGGPISEVIAIANSDTVGQREQMMQYLASRYGVVLT